MAKTAQPTDRALFRKTVDRKPVTRKARAENVRPANPNKHKTVPVAKVRPSLGAGTVAILLAGPYKGRRVVVVKSLESGNVAVTGPYNVNGIPLRRVNPRFVIATSTKLPVEGLDTSDLNDAFFNKIKAKKTATKEKEDVFMSQGNNTAAARVIPEVKVAAQKKVDGPLVQFCDRPENALLKQYLKTRFTLRDKMFPHALKF